MGMEEAGGVAAEEAGAMAAKSNGRCGGGGRCRLLSSAVPAVPA